MTTAAIVARPAEWQRFLMWKRVLVYAFPEVRADIHELHVHAENRRQLAHYNTGSIPEESAVALRAFALWLAPEIVIEVGTFIGFSTEALLAPCVKRIYTCDKDNDCLKPTKRITCYPKTRSTQMLRALAESGVKADLFFFDGRIQDEDLSLIAKLSKPFTAYLFDDFVGQEKGVINVDKLAPQLPDHVLLAPDPPETIYGMSIAALLPRGLCA